MKIPALTLWQPWASLVAIGAKKIETRSWSTEYRGLLAIHAAQRFPEEAQKLFIELPFWNALRGAGYEFTSKLPRGAIVAVAKLFDVQGIGNECLYKYQDDAIIGTKMPLPTGNELVFGDYNPGRFAWMLEDIKQLSEPIPAKGWQRLWNWEVPEGVRLP